MSAYDTKQYLRGIQPFHIFFFSRVYYICEEIPFVYVFSFWYI